MSCSPGGYRRLFTKRWLFGVSARPGYGACKARFTAPNTTKPGWLARLFFAWNWSGQSRF